MSAYYVQISRKTASGETPKLLLSGALPPRPPYQRLYPWIPLVSQPQTADISLKSLQFCPHKECVEYALCAMYAIPNHRRTELV